MSIFLKIYLSPLLILSAGLYLRLKGIIAGTFAITFDQGRDLLAASSIVDGHLTLIGPTTGLAGVFHGPLWYWLLAVFSFLGRGDPKFILGLIILLYATTQFWLYWTVKKYYGFWLAVIILGLVSFSPFFVANVGQLWSPNLVVLATMIAAVALIEIATGKKWYWLLGLALGVNIQFEAAGGTFLAIATILALVLVKPTAVKLKDYLTLFGGFVLTLLPQILFEARHGFLMTKHVINYLGERPADLIAEYGFKTVEYKTGLFFDNFHKLFFDENVTLNLAFIFLLFVFALKTFVGNRTTKKTIKISEKLILIWGVEIIFFMWLAVNFYTDVVWNHFLFPISVFYMITISFLLFNFYKVFPKASLMLILFTFLGILIPFLKDLKADGEYIGDHSVFRNKLKIIDEVYNDAGELPFNVVVYEPTTFSYGWDYLFNWYGHKTYGKLPVGNDLKQKIVYFIIEPDSIAGRRNEWVRQRIGEGEVVWSKEYWSDNGVEGDGFLLQKRVRGNGNYM